MCDICKTLSFSDPVNISWTMTSILLLKTATHPHFYLPEEILVPYLGYQVIVKIDMEDYHKWINPQPEQWNEEKKRWKTQISAGICRQLRGGTRLPGAGELHFHGHTLWATGLCSHIFSFLRKSSYIDFSEISYILNVEYHIKLKILCRTNKTCLGILDSQHSQAMSWKKVFRQISGLQWVCFKDT